MSITEENIEFKTEYMAEKLLIILEEEFMLRISLQERVELKLNIKKVLREYKEKLKIKNHLVDYGKILEDWARNIKFRSTNIKEESGESEEDKAYYKGFSEGLMAASQHLLYLEDIRKEKYKIDLTDMKLSKKEIEDLSKDLALISDAVPDYAFGRRLGFSDDETERRASIALTKATNLTDDLLEGLVECPHCKKTTLAASFCGHCSYRLI